MTGIICTSGAMQRQYSIYVNIVERQALRVVSHVCRPVIPCIFNGLPAWYGQNVTFIYQIALSTTSCVISPTCPYEI